MSHTIDSLNRAEAASADMRGLERDRAALAALTSVEVGR